MSPMRCSMSLSQLNSSLDHSQVLHSPRHGSPVLSPMCGGALGTMPGLSIPALSPFGLVASPREHRSSDAKSVDKGAASTDDLSLPPFFYEADPTDPMDVALLQELVALNLEVSARLNIKRMKPGEYEIESVRVSLYWQTAELFVRARRRKKRRKSAGDDGAIDDVDTPLAMYLRQLANVDNQPKKLTTEPPFDPEAAAAAFANATGGSGVSGGVCGPSFSRMGATTPEMPFTVSSPGQSYVAAP